MSALTALSRSHSKGYRRINVMRLTPIFSIALLLFVSGSLFAQEWIEFDSMINVRPSGGNRSRHVESAEIRGAVANIVNRLVGE